MMMPPEEMPMDPAMMGPPPADPMMQGAPVDPMMGAMQPPMDENMQLQALLGAVQSGWQQQEAEVMAQQDALMQVLMEIAQMQQGPAPEEVFAEGAPMPMPSDTMPPEAPEQGMF